MDADDEVTPERSADERIESSPHDAPEASSGASDDKIACDQAAECSRRGLISTCAAGVALGAAGIYATKHVLDYLTPPNTMRTRETFIAFADAIPEGGTLAVTLPSGQNVQIRRGEEDFAGFSDVCPHLGCRVHWVAADAGETNPDKRGGWFRCPCHEGWFGADGEAFAGPPKEANQRLERIDLVRRGNSLYARFEEAAS